MNGLNKVKKLCSEEGISIKELEKKLNIPTNTLYQWKKCPPNINRLEKISAYFNVTIDYLLDKKYIHDIGPIIKSRRLERELSKNKVCESLLISSKQLKFIEDYNVPVNYDIAIKLFDFLSLDKEILLENLSFDTYSFFNFETCRENLTEFEREQLTLFTNFLVYQRNTK